MSMTTPVTSPNTPTPPISKTPSAVDPAFDSAPLPATAATAASSQPAEVYPHTGDFLRAGYLVVGEAGRWTNRFCRLEADGRLAFFKAAFNSRQRLPEVNTVLLHTVARIARGPIDDAPSEAANGASPLMPSASSVRATLQGGADDSAAEADTEGDGAAVTPLRGTAGYSNGQQPLQQSRRRLSRSDKRRKGSVRGAGNPIPPAWPAEVEAARCIALHFSSGTELRLYAANAEEVGMRWRWGKKVLGWLPLNVFVWYAPSYFHFFHQRRFPSSPGFGVGTDAAGAV